ncbi:MAG: CoA transferase [Lewinellaceae bacterium]|nr:CoA transferase [Saprospiraceae bacterium]MCB9330783.1 CoA transferase [Lewinellaceae bacterium]
MIQDSLFKGLKVVEFASVLAGPAVGMFFAELGAEVIKIENKTTGGDMTRGWKLPTENPDSPVSAYFCSVNWGKTHLLLDLGEPDDLQEALKFAGEADIVISNFRPSSARRLGLDAETLRREHPRLIYAQLNAFADPEDETPAFDVVLQAEAGFLYMTGEAGCPPVKMPVALIDLLAAHQMKEAILIALLQREREGKGASINVSLLESALASLANQATNWLMAGHVPQRMGLQHPNIAPYGDSYGCADGKQILLAVGTERQFRQLCTCLNRNDLLENPDFQTNQARLLNRAKLNSALQAVFSKKDLNTWLHLLKTHQVPAAQIRDMPAVFELPAAQNMILEELLPDGSQTKRLRTVAFAMQH